MLSLESIVFISIAYLAVVVFTVGVLTVLLKWIFRRKGPSGTYLGLPYLFVYPGQDTRLKAFVNMLKRIFLFSSMKRDPKVRYSSLAFHWSLWIVIAAHSDLFLYSYFEAAGISQATLEMIGDYAGTFFAVVMVVFGIVLLYRRIGDKYLRHLNNASDYFAVLLIVAIGITGILERFTLPGNYAYTAVSPFIMSLVSFAPINIPTRLPFLIHFSTTLVLFFYLPFSKLMHPFSFFTNPTMYSLHHTGLKQGEAK